MNDASERLRKAMLFIEEWSNWWSFALAVDDTKVTPEMNQDAGKMAESLGARARDMVVDNRRFLAAAGSERGRDTERLDELERTKCYPFWNGGEWVYIVAQERSSKIDRRGTGKTIREAIDAASPERKSADK